MYFFLFQVLHFYGLCRSFKLIKHLKLLPQIRTFCIAVSTTRVSAIVTIERPPSEIKILFGRTGQIVRDRFTSCLQSYTRLVTYTPVLASPSRTFKIACAMFNEQFYTSRFSCTRSAYSSQYSQKLSVPKSRK